MVKAMAPELTVHRQIDRMRTPITSYTISTPKTIDIPISVASFFPVPNTQP